MFKPFRFKRKEVLANPLQEKVAGKFVGAVLQVQSKWASFMDQKVNRLSVRYKKIGLGIFAGLSVLICVSIVIETFSGSHSQGSFKVQAIHSSKHFTSCGEVRASSSIPEKEYKRILVFHHYMDSIAVANRKEFDSINHCRPGLLDSAFELEKLYHTQNK